MGLLDSVRNSLNKMGSKTIIKIPIGQMRVVCHNEIHVGLEGKRMPVAHTFVNPRDFQIECDCGIIYKREL